MNRVPERFQGDGPVHFVGIGGAGMNALAEMVLRSGVPVTGCDLRAGAETERLSRLGAEISIGHDAAHVEGARMVVYSAAIPNDHVELEAAREQGIPLLKRAAALGAWVEGRTVVAVAGTHGKTSTSAMLTAVLAEAGLDPTGLVGGRVNAWDGNLRFGRSDLFVVEADEYDRSFMTLRPTVAIVTNLEADHLDIYGSLSAIKRSFRDFLGQVSDSGRVIVCGDDHGASGLLAGLRTRGCVYGLNAGAQLRGVNVEIGADRSRFKVYESGTPRGEIELSVTGLHNVRNALAAMMAARFLGAEWEAIRTALEQHSGVGRRYERVGEAGGVLVVDDYAHHPTEIEAAISTTRAAFPNRRLVAVFQPHLFSRTRDFGEALGAALAGADQVWVTEIYPARESAIPGVTSSIVTDAVRRAGGEVTEVTGLDELVERLPGSLQVGDVCLTLGAGSIGTVPARLLAGLQEVGVHG